MTTYQLVAALLRLDGDAARFFPPHDYAKAHETLLAAANAVTEAEAAQVRLADAMRWSEEVAEWSGAVVAGAKRAAAGGE